jgi:hypothetical protein
MADMFTSLVSIIPKPATAVTPGPQPGNTVHTGPGLQNQQVQTPRGK